MTKFIIFSNFKYYKIHAVYCVQLILTIEKFENKRFDFKIKLRAGGIRSKILVSALIIGLIGGGFILILI